MSQVNKNTLDTFTNTSGLFFFFFFNYKDASEEHPYFKLITLHCYNLVANFVTASNALEIIYCAGGRVSCLQVYGARTW